MISRAFAARKLFTTIYNVRTHAVRKYRCDAHMNELPIPCGPWDIWYKDRQSFYNKVLFCGAAWLLFSAWFAFYTESLYFNWGPPDQPGPPSDMVEVCEEIE